METSKEYLDKAVRELHEAQLIQAHTKESVEKCEVVLKFYLKPQLPH